MNNDLSLLIRELRTTTVKQIKYENKNAIGMCAGAIAIDLYAQLNGTTYDDIFPRPDNTSKKALHSRRDTLFKLQQDMEVFYGLEKGFYKRVPPRYANKGPNIAHHHTFGTLNNVGFTFNEIADCIEYTYTNLQGE